MGEQTEKFCLGSGGSICLDARCPQGTTAVAKKVRYTPGQLLRCGSAIAESLHLTKHDLCLNALPYYHIGGLATNLFAVLRSRSQLRCLGNFVPEKFVGEVMSRGDSGGGNLRSGPHHDAQPTWSSPTWFYVVPTMHIAIAASVELWLAERQAHQEPNHQLRFIRSASAPLPHAEAVRLWTIADHYDYSNTSPKSIT